MLFIQLLPSSFKNPIIISFSSFFSCALLRLEAFGNVICLRRLHPSLRNIFWESKVFKIEKSSLRNFLFCLIVKFECQTIDLNAFVKCLHKSFMHETQLSQKISSKLCMFVHNRWHVESRLKSQFCLNKP